MLWAMLQCMEHYESCCGTNQKVKKASTVYSLLHPFAEPCSGWYNEKPLQDTINTTFELTKLMKNSLKQDGKLESLQNQIVENEEDGFGKLNKSPKVSIVCLTQWTVCGDCFNGVIRTYDELQKLWCWSLENFTDMEMKARIHGISVLLRDPLGSLDSGPQW